MKDILVSILFVVLSTCGPDTFDAWTPNDMWMLRY